MTEFELRPVFDLQHQRDSKQSTAADLGGQQHCRPSSHHAILYGKLSKKHVAVASAACWCPQLADAPPSSPCHERGLEVEMQCACHQPLRTLPGLLSGRNVRRSSTLVNEMLGSLAVAAALPSGLMGTIQGPFRGPIPCHLAPCDLRM